MRELRKGPAKKKTQAQLAKILGLERTSIANIEAGKQKPPLHVIYRFCEHYGVPLDSVLPPVGAVRISTEKDAQAVEFGGETYAIPAQAATALEKLRHR